MAVGITTSRRKNPRASFRLENQYYRQGFKVVAGLDEVGRGAWAGPLVAAAVILPRDLHIGKIFDSKALNHEQRAKLNSLIRARALSFGIGQSSVSEIEVQGLTAALLLAYRRALAQLDPKPDLVLLDGRRFKGLPIKHQAIIKGDCKAKSIAAASIIAKEYRDELMIKLAGRYPYYGFERHKGYGTERHRQALKEHGVLEVHRKNYNWVKQLFEKNREQQ